MYCKKCGKKTVVLQTITKGEKGTIVKRVRMCEQCGHEFITIEKEVEE